MTTFFKKAFNFYMLMLLVMGCNKDEQQQANSPSFPVIEIPKDSITGYRSFPARVEGTVNVEVRPKISGFIDTIYVDEGQKVKRGERLFKLEARSLEEEAEAAASAISTARANVASAQVEVEKLIPLVEEDIISEVQLASARENLNAAKAQLAQAKNNYSSVQENVDYRYVTSSVAGVVGSIPYRQGTLVGANQPMPLTVVSEIDSVFAYFSMNEKEYFSFLRETEGEALQEKINNFPDILLVLADDSQYDQKGRIQTTTGQIDPETGTATFRAIFPNPNRLLNAGNSGTVKIPKLYQDVLLVPSQATFEEQARTYVYRLSEGDTIRKDMIEVADNIGNMLVVTKGLEESDRIVAKGVNQLQDKMKIQPKEIPFDSLANGIEQVFK